MNPVRLAPFGASLLLAIATSCGSGGQIGGEPAGSGGSPAPDVAFGSGGTSSPGSGGSGSGGAPPEPDAAVPVVDPPRPPAPGGPLVHPGVMMDKGMLDFVKGKIAAGAAPWTAALARLKSSNLGSLSYTPHPRAVVECGSYSNPDLGCTDEKADSSAAYTQALLWYHTGDMNYARKAIEIMNAWSSTVKSHTNSNAPLQSAWVSENFPRAAEIIRYSGAGWPAAEVEQFATMLRTVYLPQVIKGSGSNGNWELSMIEAVINIGVFIDDRATFDKGVEMWRKRVPAYFYLTSDGPQPIPPPTGARGNLVGFWYGQSMFVDGLCQETCRDIGHTQYGLAATLNAAATAAAQGVDLFGAEQKRLMATLEFHAGFLNGGAVPSWLCGGRLTDNSPDPMWEIGLRAYATVLGQPMPNTQRLIQRIRPTGSDHHMNWETLTHGDVPASTP